MTASNDYQHLVDRIERLERSFSEQQQITTKMLATLEHISKTLDDMVNGKGTVRCATHTEKMRALELEMQRNHNEATGFTRRISDSFDDCRNKTDAKVVALDERLDKLEGDRAKLVGALIAIQAIFTLIFSYFMKR